MLAVSTCNIPPAAQVVARVANASNRGSCTCSKPFDAMNGIAASMLLNMTSSMRFEGSLNVDLNDITMNLVPYPQPGGKYTEKSKQSKLQHRTGQASALFAHGSSCWIQLCTPSIPKYSFLVPQKMLPGQRHFVVLAGALPHFLNVPP
eukprot:1153972-Pelagomonas_calceolata.AAC.3